MKTLRISAVISSILLVGGYVYYQTRAEGRWGKPVMPSSKLHSPPIAATAPTTQAGLTLTEPVLSEYAVASGTKAGVPIVAVPKASERAVLPGSKSAPVFDRPGHEDDASPVVYGEAAAGGNPFTTRPSTQPASTQP